MLYFIKDVVKREDKDYDIYDNPEIICFILSNNIIIDILTKTSIGYNEKDIRKYKGYKLID